VVAGERAEELLSAASSIPTPRRSSSTGGISIASLFRIQWFKLRPKTPRPDFTAFAVTDFGQTIQLGEYEAAADAILYEFDEEARRMKEWEVEQDTTFGGALRRLRLQRAFLDRIFPASPRRRPRKATSRSHDCARGQPRHAPRGGRHRRGDSRAAGLVAGELLPAPDVTGTWFGASLDK
jgi:hypothetical protein